MKEIDLLKLTETLIKIPSVSFQEEKIAEFIFGFLTEFSHVKAARIGNCVYATIVGKDMTKTLCMAGHIDTVPENNNLDPKYNVDKLIGLGATDMKGGLAVMLKLAANLDNPIFNLKFIFYPREEVDSKFNGLRELYGIDSAYLESDAAILLEPTNGYIEAGCQGVVKLKIKICGQRAHSARPWMGINAIHRSYGLIKALNDFAAEEPTVDSLQYRESFQAVLIEGGVATNVVPDEVIITASYRFAPNKTSAEALGYIKSYMAEYLDEELGDGIEVVDVADPASPGVFNELIKEIIANAHGIKPKFGWTDVAFFSKLNIPAINFGPGDAALAHSPDEFITSADLEKVYNVLFDSIK